MKAKRKARAYRGSNGKWGVEADAVLYDAVFSKRAAVRIAELESRRTPPKTWEETREILLKEGFEV